jgi:aspartate-semialdehyde dehydrogenase
MKLSSARIVVTGATSVRGRDVLNILAEQGVDRKHVSALEPGRPAGEQISFGVDHVIDIKAQDGFDFKDADVVLHAGVDREAAGLARLANAAGTVFIDGSGVFAMDPDVPLIVPEVNGDSLADGLKKNVIASPGSLGIFLALALYPLHKNAKVIRVVASTYQGVSNWGREAQDELFSQTKAIFMTQDLKPQYLPKQIAFNCYPLVGHEREDGTTDTEWQAVAHLKKILDPKIKVAINTVTVPAFVGDGIMVNAECAEDISPIKATLWMTGQKGLGVIEDDNFCTHADITGEDFTYVSRLRDDMSVENGLSFWLIGDNLRKGSALNMVQIAEAWLKDK